MEAAIDRRHQFTYRMLLHVSRATLILRSGKAGKIRVSANAVKIFTSLKLLVVEDNFFTSMTVKKTLQSMCN